MRRVLHLMFVFKPIPVSGEILSDETFLLIRRFICLYDLLGSRGDSEPRLRPQVNSESSSSDSNLPFFFFCCMELSADQQEHETIFKAHFSDTSWCQSSTVHFPYTRDTEPRFQRERDV